MVRASSAGADSINWFRGEIAVVFDKNTPKRDCIRRADGVACRKRHQSIRAEFLGLIDDRSRDHRLNGREQS
jgi:hypothetical protein